MPGVRWVYLISMRKFWPPNLPLDPLLASSTRQVRAGLCVILFSLRLKISFYCIFAVRIAAASWTRARTVAAVFKSPEKGFGKGYRYFNRAQVRCTAIRGREENSLAFEKRVLSANASTHA